MCLSPDPVSPDPDPKIIQKLGLLTKPKVEPKKRGRKTKQKSV